MTKILSLAAVIGWLVAASPTADARGGGLGGASGFAPGQSFRGTGAVAGHPGASGFAPGHLRRIHGSVSGHPGASGFAPGHRFMHH
jgi:hypothetical protein